MDFDIDSDIEKRPDLLRHVESANRFLLTLLGKSEVDAKATWKLLRGTPAGTGLALELSILDDRVTESFTPSEFDDRRSWQDKLDRAWWKLLSQSQKHSAEKIIQLLQEWKQELVLADEGV